MLFNSTRLALARKRRGLSKIGLANAVGLVARTISLYESGSHCPPESTVVALAQALRFPVDFFYGPSIDEPPTEGASFRSLKSMTSGQRDAVLAAGALAYLLHDWVAQRFTLPPTNIPDLREYKPEEAADYVRSQWKQGQEPIKNMIHLLEFHGVRVFSLVEDNAEVDAFSIWRKDVPFVFLNTMKSAEHSRFDAAHELGHLVLHRHEGRGRDLEREANRFASAFLMPAGSVLGAAPCEPSLDRLVALKRRWNVSVAALVYRLRSLNLLSEWHYRTLCVEINKRGFRKTEPNGIAREKSQILTKVFTALWTERVTREEVAKQLQIPAEELDAFVFEVIRDPRCEPVNDQGDSEAVVPRLRLV